jgi:hypothetical protein
MPNRAARRTLGLAALTLDDINWLAREITVPADASEAIRSHCGAAYHFVRRKLRHRLASSRMSGFSLHRT